MDYRPTPLAVNKALAVGALLAAILILQGAASAAEEIELKGHTGWVYCVAFSPDGTHVATGSGDGIFRVWSLPDGKASFFPGVVTKKGKTVFLPPRGGAKEKEPSLRIAPLSVTAVVFSSDGKTVISGHSPQRWRWLRKAM